MFKFLHTPKVLHELECGDIIRLYPSFYGRRRYKRDYLLIIWGQERYRYPTNSYTPLFALNLNGKPCDSIGIQSDTRVGPPKKEDYFDLSLKLMEAGLKFNLKTKKLIHINDEENFNDYRPTE